MDKLWFILVEHVPSTVSVGGEAQAHKLLLHLQCCILHLASVKLREEPATKCIMDEK